MVEIKILLNFLILYKDATIYMDRKFNISKTAEKLLENLHVK